MSRIVILANSIDELGGAQRVAHSLAQGLALRGHRVELVGIVPYVPRHQFTENPAYRTATLNALPQPPRTSPVERERHRVECTDALRDLLAAGEPGIVIATQVWAMEHLTDIPTTGWRVIAQYHSSFEEAARGRELARAVAACSRADAFVLLTPEDAAGFRRAGMNNTTWMPNALTFRPDQPAPLSGHTVTYLGRLSAEKGPRFLVDAWSRIVDRHPDWVLRFVGDGPQSEAIRAQAAGIDRIEFRERTEDPEPVLLGSDIVVLPSLVEGFPLVLAEAMACGVPCVVTDCSAGVRLLVEDGFTGVLAARGNAGSLAQGLERLMDSEDVRRLIGTQARSRVEEFMPSTVLDRWEQLLVDVLR